MKSPLTIFPDRTAVLPPQYLGSISYYALLAAYEHVVIDVDMRRDKRFKSAHRCDIASTHGQMQLTVPVAKTGLMGKGWDQTPVSDHAGWWSDHVISLESAYGRTPFFEFYFDRLRPWLRAPQGITVGQLDAAIDCEIRAMLHLDNSVSYDIADAPADAIDYRKALPTFPTIPYYQVRADRLGFIPDLSIVDLIFNLGPEAPLILHQMQKSAFLNSKL